MSSNDIAVSVRGLAKSYTIAHNSVKHTTLGEALIHKVKKPVAKVEKETFWALNGIDFDVMKGDVVGIIGRNGAGKSTLLKILSQITEPTKGEVRLYGRVGSLLEVGTGFHPELTGRENIFLNGAILGMRKTEIQRQFDEIVDFSGVEKFLDTPVKRYSSGMYVRLAFAVAAHLNPEIMVVDEVLAVGDAGFQKKCMAKMEQVAHAGRTVLFVSHNMGAIRNLCEKGIVLSKGQVLMTGNATQAVEAYLQDLADSLKQKASFSEDKSHQINIREISVYSPDGEGSRMDVADPIEVEVKYTIHEDIKGGNLCLQISHEGSLLIRSFDLDLDPERAELRPAGDYIARVSVPAWTLAAGRYSIGIDCGILKGAVIERYPDCLFFELEHLKTDVTRASFSRPGAMLSLPLRWENSYTGPGLHEPVLASAASLNGNGLAHSKP